MKIQYKNSTKHAVRLPEIVTVNVIGIVMVILQESSLTKFN